MTKEVEDRGSSIRVAGLRAIPVGGKAYVKVETSMGITGWGEINTMNTPVACALAESMGEMIVGENPTRTEHLWQRMFRAHRNLRGGGFMVPEGPGLGVEIDAQKAVEAGQDPKRQFKWPDNRLKDGAVADY